MNKQHNEALGTLNKLRQGALLLSMANKFFCDPPLLEKIGGEMDRSLQKLPGQIKSLKSQFPGKWEEESTESLVSNLQQTVRQLQNPEPGTRAKCGDGELGRELEKGVESLTAAVDAIADKVEGRFPERSSKKASDRTAYGIADLISTFLRKLVPALVLLAGMACLAFGYLYWSMDREDATADRIATVEGRLRSSQRILAEIDIEKNRVFQRMETLKKNDLPRAEKIEFMDLGLELHKIEERKIKAEVDVDLLEKELQNLRAELQKIKGKSFLSRLFRR